MGQGQSQINGKGQALGEARPGTAESENQMDPEERAKLQAEDRERRAAAAQQRFDSMQNKRRVGGSGAKTTTAPKKKSALEELSAENRGWRAADEQANLRAYN